MSKPDYDTTLARMAGNIAGRVIMRDVAGNIAAERVADDALAIADAIVTKLKARARAESENK